MVFNIHKYDEKIFHNNNLIDKRLRALTLWYEYQIFNKGLNLNGKIKTLELLIRMSAKNEWFEVSDYFYKIKSQLII